MVPCHTPRPRYGKMRPGKDGFFRTRDHAGSAGAMRPFPVISGPPPPRNQTNPGQACAKKEERRGFRYGGAVETDFGEADEIVVELIHKRAIIALNVELHVTRRGQAGNIEGETSIARLPGGFIEFELCEDSQVCPEDCQESQF